MAKNMATSIAKTVTRGITLMLAASAVAFVLIQLSPIDPVQAYVGAGVSVSPEQRDNIAAYWGLGQPPLKQFFAWGTAVLHGDLGISLIYRRPVTTVIGEKFMNSLALMGSAWLFSGVFGLVAGALMGRFKDRWPDKILKPLCMTLTSTPTFWLGLVLMMVFSVALGWFPVGMSVPAGTVSANVTLAQKIHHLILPSLTLGLTGFSGIALHTRQKLSDVYNTDFMLFAKARGETQRQRLFRHGLRNIILPALTLQFASFSELFGGSVLCEQIFSYPGLGQAVVAAGLRADVPLLLGISIFSTLFVFAGNTLANMIYRAVDPRIRGRYAHD